MSTTMTGFLLSKKLEKRVKICFQLSSLCDALLYDMSYRATPVCTLLQTLIKSESFAELSFISDENIKHEKEIVSCLKSAENKELSRFLYSLGKSDIINQKRLIEGFKTYILHSLDYYEQAKTKNTKLYITFGAFFGIVSALIIV